MIKEEKKVGPSGVQTTIYKNENCQLKFIGFSDIPVPGYIEHRTEICFAPTGIVTGNSRQGWQMALNMPKQPVPLEEWSNLIRSANQIIQFWSDVEKLL